MITESEYQQILPHREDIIKFQKTKSLTNQTILTIANVIQQRRGMGAINFGCDGCKIQAMKDLYGMMVMYEETLKTAQ